MYMNMYIMMHVIFHVCCAIECGKPQNLNECGAHSHSEQPNVKNDRW